MKDALGSEIIIGNYYGHSRCQNGLNTIHIGEAIRVTDNGTLRLKVVNTKRGAYLNVSDSLVPRKPVSVKAVLVFPVDVEEVR